MNQFITISNLHADQVETFMTISKCYIQKTQNPHSVRTTKQFDNSWNILWTGQILVRMSPIKLSTCSEKKKLNKNINLGVQHYTKTESPGWKFILKVWFFNTSYL